MKLASLKKGGRDGTLIVVSRDLSSAVPVPAIAETMQAALDRWVVGSGTVSNRDRSVGSSCLQERRMIEKIETGDFATPFLQYGDVARIEVLDAKGATIFGAIEQRVAKPHALPSPTSL